MRKEHRRRWRPGGNRTHSLARDGLLDQGLKIRTLTLPDRFIEHDTPVRMYDEAGLNAAQIVRAALDGFGQEAVVRPLRA